MAVTNLRVACKTIPCVSAFTEMAILLFFLEIAAGLDAIVGVCHRTSDGQVHKIIWRAGPEQDTYVSQSAESKAASD